MNANGGTADPHGAVNHGQEHRSQRVSNHGSGTVHAPMYVAGNYVVEASDAPSADIVSQDASARFGSPLPPTPLFVGRESVVDEVLRVIGAADGRSVHVIALVGMAGVGKTEIAIEIASHLDCPTYWVDASSRASAVAQTSSIAGLLTIDAPANVHSSIERVKAELADRGNFLLVYDSAGSIETLRDIVPTTGQGCILVTSTDPNWRDVAQVIDVEPLARDSAVDLLQRRANRSTDMEGAYRLADALGDLPLALTQAAAYCEQTGRSFNSFVDLLVEQDPHLWNLPLAERSQKSMNTVWRLAVDAFFAELVGAAALLGLLAFAPRSGLPVDRLRARWTDCTHSILNKTAEDLDLLIASLRGGSLVSITPDHLIMHPALAAYVRGELSAGVRVRSIAYLLREASRALPARAWRKETWASTGPAAEQVLTLSRFVRQYDVRMRGAGVYERAASFFSSRWMHEEAAVLLELALEQSESRSPSVLLRLGHSLRSSGRPDEASVVFEELLEREPQVPRTHVARANRLQLYAHYAMSLVEAAKYEDGVSWFDAALSEAELVFGRPSTEVAKISGRLAASLRRMGEVERAVEVFEVALTELEQLGHLDTQTRARTLGSLGRCHTEAGHPELAVPLASEAVEIKRRLVPPGAPPTSPEFRDVAQSLLGLAAAYAALKDAPRCKAALDDASAIFAGNYVTASAQWCQVHLIEAQLADALGRTGDALKQAQTTERLAAQNPSKFVQESVAARRILAAHAAARS